MSNWAYAAIWLVFTVIPLLAALKKRWLVFSIYAAGWLVFLYSVLQRKDGWDDLVDFVILIVVVIPIYLAASLIWLVGWWMRRRNAG